MVKANATLEHPADLIADTKLPSPELMLLSVHRLGAPTIYVIFRRDIQMGSLMELLSDDIGFTRSTLLYNNRCLVSEDCQTSNSIDVYLSVNMRGGGGKAQPKAVPAAARRDPRRPPAVTPPAPPSFKSLLPGNLPVLETPAPVTRSDVRQ